MRTLGLLLFMTCLDGLFDGFAAGRALAAAEAARNHLTPARIELPREAAIFTHASRHYHSDPETLAFTARSLREFRDRGRVLIGLGQEEIASDRLWYAQPFSLFTHLMPSLWGEHVLYFSSVDASAYRVTLLGGYHSACLGNTVALLLSRFLRESPSSRLEFEFLMKGIFTGFRRLDGVLVPSTADQESWLDDSVDGLNLDQLTREMGDEEWAEFMMESLRIAVFRKAPLRFIDFRSAGFELRRKGIVLRSFYLPVAGMPVVIGEEFEANENSRRLIIFNYR